MRAKLDISGSGRVAIAEALKAAMPERRGKDNPDNCPELKGRDLQHVDDGPQVKGERRVSAH